MPRRGENIYLRRDGRWEGRCIMGKKENGSCLYRYVYGHSYQSVKEKLAVERAAMLLYPGRDIKGKTPSMAADNRSRFSMNEDVRFSVLTENWLNAKESQVRESTYIKYRNLAVSYILPELGSVRWGSLNREAVNSFCQRLLSFGGIKQTGLSPKTVSDIMSVIRSIFRYAQSLGYEASFDISSIIIKKESKEMRSLTRKEQDKLCSFLLSELNDQNIGLLVCMFAGLRLGELCALKWEDISFSEQTIHVHRTMQRIQSAGDFGKKTKIVITPPKSSDSNRTIPIPRELAGILLSYKRWKKGYVLTGREDIYVEPRAMERYFDGVLKKIGLQKVNFHALRHTFATRCVEMNFDAKSLSEILGHSNVNITMDRYVHPSMELKRQNMQRLSELLAVG